MDELVEVYTTEEGNGNLPKIYADAIRESKTALARTNNPQIAEFILDKAYYHDMLAHAKKTGKLYDLPVVDCAAALIERHRGVSRLLATCERYSSARHFTSFCNGQLQRINLPALHGITLTMYWARHTWATVAAGLDIPTDTIAAALGHGSHTVTDIYIRRDASKVDEALRQVASKLPASCGG
jgi:integrase